MRVPTARGQQLPDQTHEEGTTALSCGHTRTVTSHPWPANAVVDVTSVDELVGLIAKGKLDQYTMVWRGVANISWPLDSSLFRKLAVQHGRDHVTEAMMQTAEQELIAEARRLRFDRMPGGEVLGDLALLATLQHQGAATRLVDGTFNPLIAAWFAVEDEQQDEEDGALLGIDMTDRSLDPQVAERGGPMRDVLSKGDFRLWRPPPVEQRIRAQQAVFILGKVPAPVTEMSSLDVKIMNRRADRLFVDNPGSGRYAKRPLFVLRVQAGVKQQLRRFLTGRLGMDAVSMYPDLAGFARARRA